jgi:hypothetical protein
MGRDGHGDGDAASISTASIEPVVAGYRVNVWAYADFDRVGVRQR